MHKLTEQAMLQELEFKRSEAVEETLDKYFPNQSIEEEPEEIKVQREKLSTVMLELIAVYEKMRREVVFARTKVA